MVIPLEQYLANSKNRDKNYAEQQKIADSGIENTR